MDYYSSHITKLIEELSKLPGVGAKSAQRLAFHIINRPIEEVQRLSDTIIDARKNVRYCKECFTLTDDELCPICKNDARDHKTIMVVENTRDLAAYEKTGKYDGVYHVLHGAISPMLGIGPGDIKLKELMTRLQGDLTDHPRKTRQLLIQRRRDNGDVHQQADQADRYQSQSDCQRGTGGRRSGIY